MGEFTESLAKRLRGARLRAGLSQGQLQLRSGVPKSRLSRYENGHLVPSLQTLRRLSRALQVSEGTLLDPREESLDAFVETLRGRGVEIGSVEDARGLAHTVADVLLGRQAQARA